MSKNLDLLDRLIEEATIDCYDEEECRIGFFTMIEDNLDIPFSAKVANRPVAVMQIDCDGRTIKAMIQDKLGQLWVDILDLEVDPELEGIELLQAYHKWEKGA